MKWKLAIVAAALVFPLGAGADTYIKIDSHTDGFYAGGTTTPAEDASNELWVGEKRLAYVTEGRKFIIDAEKQTFTFVNKVDNSFIESPLPLDLTKLFSEEEAGRLLMFAREGTVTKTEAGKKIGEWDCVEYALNDWIPFEGGKVYERETRAWVVAELPFSEEAFDKMFVNMLKLNGLADSYVEQLLTIQGFQVATEETTYQEGMAIGTTTRVVEMVEKEPPADVYAVPEGATAKEILSLQELRN